jgi:2-phosphosulfolactate phosphatase
MEPWQRQQGYLLRCEWGEAGVRALAPDSDVVIIVDVLSFSTCVDIALGRGAAVYPFPYKDDRAAQFAREKQAILAGNRDEPGGFSLSPKSLLELPADARLVLPSPNGATLSLLTGDTPTLAGCLRNAHTVAAAAVCLGKRISVIPAGERWPDGSLRPAWEDVVGAGAILSHLSGHRSPEATLASAAFATFQGTLRECASGRELIERGFAEDVALSAELNASSTVPMLQDGAYVNARQLIRPAGGG